MREPPDRVRRGRDLSPSTHRPRLVLVGAGHAHAIVLERWAKARRPAADIVVVTDREASLYSGMIPGWIAGEYERRELEMDARLMARRAGARLVVGRVTRVEAEERALLLADGTRISYDIGSLDLGSSVRGMDGPGDPDQLSARQPARVVERLTQGSVDPVVVLGGGAAGVELAACARAVVDGPVSLVEAAERLMTSHSPAVSERVQAALEDRAVTVHLGTATSAPPRGGVTLRATGATGPSLLADSGLPVDTDGFVRVTRDLRVVGHDHLFAAGDCASRDRDPDPKSGFHAIQQGRTLADNLVHAATHWPQQPPSLQGHGSRTDFLTLLNLGDGHAMGTKWGLTVEGRWVRRLKDLIDRRFVRRFQGS